MLIEKKYGGARGITSEVEWWGGGVGDVTETTNNCIGVISFFSTLSAGMRSEQTSPPKIAASLSGNWWIGVPPRCCGSGGRRWSACHARHFALDTILENSRQVGERCGDPQ